MLTLVAVVLSIVLIGITIYNFESYSLKEIDFTLETLEDENVSLSDYKGDLIFLNFWASWCEPCIEEMPALMKINDTYINDGISVITVNRTMFEYNVENVHKFVDEQNISLPILLDKDNKVGEQYNVTEFPATIVIDRNFEVDDIIMGEVTEQQLIDIISRYF